MSVSFLVNPMCIFGFTFDPCDSNYYIKERSDYRATGHEKRLLNGTELKGLNDEDIAKLLTKNIKSLVDNSAFPELQTDTVRIGYREDEAPKESLVQYICTFFPKKNGKKKSLRNAIPHFNGMLEKPNRHRLEKNPEDLKNLWVGKELAACQKELKSLYARHSDNIPDEVSASADETIQFIFQNENGSYWLDAIKGTEFEEYKDEIIGYIASLGHIDDIEASCSCFRAVWLLSYITASPAILAYYVTRYDINVAADDFPYINLELINYYRDWLSKSDEEGRTRLEALAFGSPLLSEIQSLCKNHSRDDSIWSTLYEIKSVTDRIASEDALKHRAESFFTSLDNTRKKLTSKFDEIGLDVVDSRLLSRVAHVDSVFKSVIGSGRDGLQSNDFASEIIKHLDLAEFDRGTIEVLSFISEWESTHIEMTSVRTEVKEISELKDSLIDGDNLEKLSALKKSYSIAGEQQEAVAQQALTALSCLESSLGELDVAINSTRERERVMSTDDEKSSLIDKLNADKRDLRLELEETKRKLQKVTVVQEADKPETTVFSDPLVDEAWIASILENQVSLFDVVTVLADRFSETSTIAPGVWKSLKNNTHFLRLGTLYSKLRVLMSPGFLHGFNQHGAQFAFKHFTTKELAFNESQTTMSTKGNTRSFVFSDGLSRVCDSHLRVGNNGNKQHMLRIYFAIENGHLYIGEITTHLPTSTKR